MRHGAQRLRAIAEERSDRQTERDTRKNMNIRLVGRDMTCKRREQERKRQRQVDFTANFTLNNNINCPSMEHKRRKEEG